MFAQSQASRVCARKGVAFLGIDTCCPPCSEAFYFGGDVLYDMIFFLETCFESIVHKVRESSGGGAESFCLGQFGAGLRSLKLCWWNV